MKLLLMGGSGFLGGELIGSLLSEPEVERIYCLVHHAPVRTDDARIRTVQGSAGEMDKLVLPERVDACVVVSGVIDGRGADRRSTLAVNYGGTKKAIEFCKKNGIGEIFFTSSINARLEKKGIYAESKLLAEKAVRNSGLRYMIFRPALIYGYHQKYGIGVIETFIRKCGIVPVFGDGKKLEQPVFVGECADIMSHYILGGAENRILEIFGKDAYAYDDICRLIGRLIGKKVRLIHLPVLPFEIALSVLERLGMPFPISLEQIYHIDSDLSGKMEKIYEETGIQPESFGINFLKEKNEICF